MFFWLYATSPQSDELVQLRWIFRSQSSEQSVCHAHLVRLQKGDDKLQRRIAVVGVRHFRQTDHFGPSWTSAMCGPRALYPLQERTLPTIALTLRKYRTAFAIEGNMNSSAIDLSDILESREQ